MTVVHFTPTGGKIITDLTHMFHGQTALLVGGSPTLTSQPIEALSRRGVLTLAMNNAALHFQPTLWCGVDRPECFDPQILLDPRIIKFGNLAHAEVELDDRYQRKRYRQFPNMFFLVLEDNVPWDEFLAPRRGIPWYNNTLFTSICVLYQLGIRRIVLAGSDFAQGPNGSMYAHSTSLTPLETKWNTDLYTSLVHELRRMRPLFDRSGLEFYDCSVNSRLEPTYTKLTMEQAVAMCLDRFPAAPLPPKTLPHCSKFANESIQERIARWPGYTLVNDIRARKAQQD